MTATTVEVIREGLDITEHLADDERERFQVCESIIQKGLNTFLEVGAALAEIRDNRYYRETHDTFELYCRDIWDLSKSKAYYQISGYESVKLLESEMSTIVEKIQPKSKTDAPAPADDCSECKFRKAMANKKKGVRIPDQFGKCTREGGLCEKFTQPAQTFVLPLNEAQARMLTPLSPEDHVKAWVIVLEKLNQDPKAKLTASLVGKAVRQVKGEVVKKKLKNAQKAVEDTVLVSNIFTKQYQVLVSIITEAIDNGWKDMKPTETVKHLESLIKIITDSVK